MTNWEKFRLKYGQRVYDLLLNFPEHPELVPQDLASLAGLSPQHIRKLLHDLHGTSKQPRLAWKCKVVRPERFGVQLQRILGGVPRKRIGLLTFKNPANGRTFAIRNLRIASRESYVYLTCNLRTQVDYVVGVINERYFVFPLLKKANGVVYFRVEFVTRFENAFHFLITHKGKGDYENANQDL